MYGSYLKSSKLTHKKEINEDQGNKEFVPKKMHILLMIQRIQKILMIETNACMVSFEKNVNHG